MVEAIVKQHPGLNGTQIKKLARQRGISKRKVDQSLGRGRYEMVPGKGNSTHYTIVEETAAAESEIPISPAPKREGNREIEPSLLR